MLCINIFSNEGSKFCSKAFCKLLSLKQRSLKFDQELSACWKKSYRLRYQLPTHWLYFTSKISVNFFGSGSAGSGSCLQIYCFHIPGYNTPLRSNDVILSSSSDIYFEVLDTLSLIICFCNCYNNKNYAALFPEFCSLLLSLMKQ